MSPTGVEGSAVFTALWWIVAAVVVIAAFLMIQLPDLLKAALALVTSFMGVAGLFVMLNAEFLAVVQLLIYAGAIPILIIFAILLMRDVQRGNPFNRLRVPALFLAAAVLAMIVLVVLDTDWTLLREAQLTPVAQEKVAEVYSNSTPVIAGLLLQEFVLPLEAAAVVLLAAILGAIVLVRER